MGEPRPRGERAPRRDRRGATTALNYALLLVIVSLLVAGLFVGVSDLVGSQQERAVRAGLETVGERLATDLATADRLVATTGGDEVRLSSSLPGTVGGATYRVTVTDPDPADDRVTLLLESTSPDVETTVTVRNRTPVAGSATGERVVVRYAGGRLEVADD